MQKLTQSLSLTQKLSPQQIQFIKLLQVPVMELSSRIEEELAINPALEEGKTENANYEEQQSASAEESSKEDDYSESADENSFEDINVSDYLAGDDYGGYKMQGDGSSPDEDDREMPIAMSTTFFDTMRSQLGFLRLDERREAIGMQLIGSIDADGYIRRDINSIVNDLAFLQNVEADVEEVTELLLRIQKFDPPGVGARDLKECLALQLSRKDKTIPCYKNASKIINFCFDEFTKKHYQRIQKKLSLSDEDLKEAVDVILKLNPKPGGMSGSFDRVQFLTPDFFLKEVNGELHLSLSSKNAPELRISRNFAEMLDTYDKSKKRDKRMRETVTFVKQKLDAAKWFIDAIKQRQDTLLRTMNAIIEFQKPFFLSGDEGKLRPMILKDVAEEIDMDISTVSRVANSKVVQTEFGLYPLKHFFSESITTDSGEGVSSKEVKHVLKQAIDAENKRKPLSDDKLERFLREKGYNIARRTVAKYREQLGIPVARLRKEL